MMTMMERLLLQTAEVCVYLFQAVSHSEGSAWLNHPTMHNHNMKESA